MSLIEDEANLSDLQRAARSISNAQVGLLKLNPMVHHQAAPVLQPLISAVTYLIEIEKERAKNG